MSTPDRKVTPPLLKNTAAAPFLYFDGAPVYGQVNGIIEIELSARALAPKADATVGVDIVCIGHLRGSPAAMTNLRAAIDAALVMLNGGDQPKH